MYTDTDLQNLIAEVTTQFTAHLAKAEDSFKAKDKDESEKDESKEKPESEVKEAKEEPAAEEAKEEGEKPASEAPAQEESPKEEASEQAPAKEASDESHGYDEEDLAHLDGMYSSMSPAELKAHHDAVRKCMDAHSAAAAPAAQEAPAEMAKSEKDVVVSEISLLKSELEAVKAKSAEEKKNLEKALSSFLTKFVEKTAPAGKAITSLDIVAKSTGAIEEKPLQKSEIDAKLLAKAKDISLSKSDRDAINSYYFHKNVETVKHLLK
jgi:hypothetical protein